MLSRVANNLYWMSRYVERTENLARLVYVSLYDALDADGGAGEDTADLWQPLLYATCAEAQYHAASEEEGAPLDVSRFITFSRANPDSIRQCVAQARENARMVRDQLSEDMWLELNSFHLFIQSEEAEALLEEQPETLFRRVIMFCLLFEGLINATILRDEGWQFIMAGKHLERADKTTRILDMLAFQGDPGRGRLASALRSCSGLSAFRSECPEDPSLDNAVSFLLFSQSFPRSVRFCIRELDTQLRAISGTPAGTFSNEAERLTGSTLAQLNYSSGENVRETGLHQYLDSLQQRFNDIGQKMFEQYVLLPLEIRSLAGAEEQKWQWQQQQQQ
jgi:uncharacterized alpha-E superfamily protein